MFMEWMLSGFTVNLKRSYLEQFSELPVGNDLIRPETCILMTKCKKQACYSSAWCAGL